MQKCSLCGGKVVNGRCEECGMPIPPEDRYTLRSEKEKVHVHEINGEEVLHRVRNAPGKKPFYQCTRTSERSAPRQPARSRQPGPKGKKSALGMWIWVFMIIAVVLTMIPDLLR